MRLMQSVERRARAPTSSGDPVPNTRRRVAVHVSPAAEANGALPPPTVNRCPERHQGE